jgi:hypothetical protein
LRIVASERRPVAAIKLGNPGRVLLAPIQRQKRKQPGALSGARRAVSCDTQRYSTRRYLADPM